MQEESLDWTRRVCESMLHVAVQTWYIGEGVLQRVVGVVPVCMLECVKGGLGRTQVVLRQSNLNWTSREGKEGRDKRARITMRE